MEFMMASKPDSFMKVIGPLKIQGQLAAPCSSDKGMKRAIQFIHKWKSSLS
jgi:hypothetical protein